jgi:acetyltransferase-like isoleucine patch superfamily enzyme
VRVIKSFFVVSFELVMVLLFSLPRFAIFGLLKACFLRIMGARIGRRVIFYPGLWIAPGWDLDVGDDVDLAKDVLITTGGGVSIGSRTLIGYGAYILSVNHSIPAVGEPFPPSGDVKKKVTIGNDVWIGARALILPGATIGDGAVVAGGAVVNGIVQKNSIVGGVPAKIIGWREGAETFSKPSPQGEKI